MFKIQALGKFGVLKRMLGPKRAVGLKVVHLWKIDTLRMDFGVKKRGAWDENGV